MPSLTLVIQDQSRKWCGSTPHHSNFQPIHLGESFTAGRDKPQTHHLRAFRSAKAAVSTSPFAFKMGLQQWFCDFRVCETALPPQRSHFSFYSPRLQTDFNEIENPNFHLHTRLWSDAIQFAWSTLECPARHS
ncbi:hypothetical protein AVEN_250977-1 [Araneus ventricosus]|uniref:Uncharacterized protein n=1 Tax=Araneus ventricosus TaxID=182803 RepID=A0A4Y2TS48_ARAVE|nr:hypothetical protein AVEN_250977-1 [Araneus ventricosus]